MKMSKFTETQIVSILKQADAGVPTKDICRQAGISVPTYYQWMRKYGGMEVSDLKRVKELEAENARLKRMYAELALDIRPQGHADGGCADPECTQAAHRAVADADVGSWQGAGRPPSLYAGHRHPGLLLRSAASVAARHERKHQRKGIDLSGYSQARLDEVARQLNERPRKTLGFEIPIERYRQAVASTG